MKKLLLLAIAVFSLNSCSKSDTQEEPIDPIGNLVFKEITQITHLHANWKLIAKYEYGSKINTISNDEKLKNKFDIVNTLDYISIDYQVNIYIFNLGFASGQYRNCIISGYQIVLGDVQFGTNISKHPEYLFRPYMTDDKQYLKTIEEINTYKLPPVVGATNHTTIPVNQRVTYIWQKN